MTCYAKIKNWIISFGLSTKTIYGLLLLTVLLIGGILCLIMQSHLWQNTVVKAHPVATRVSPVMSQDKKPLPHYKVLSYNAKLHRDPFGRMQESFVKQNQITNLQTVGIAHLDIHTLTMLGYIKKGNQSYGIMQAPNGAVYLVRTGDCIGKERGKVVGIYQDEILVLIPGQTQATLFNIKA